MNRFGYSEEKMAVLLARKRVRDWFKFLYKDSPALALILFRRASDAEIAELVCPGPRKLTGLAEAVKHLREDPAELKDIKAAVSEDS